MPESLAPGALRRRQDSWLYPWPCELKRLKGAKLYLIPASEDTRGHGTTGMAKFWKAQMQQWLDTVPAQ